MNVETEQSVDFCYQHCNLSNPYVCSLYFSTQLECPDLATLRNGMATWTTLSVGGVATYTCSDTFELMGESIRTCERNRTWSGVAPTCKCMCTKIILK